MENIRELLAEKGHDVWSIGPDVTVFEAIELMSGKEIGALVVVDHDRLVGIMSERDYARKVILDGRSSKDTLVREIMTLRVIYAQPHQSIEDCMMIMSDNRIRHMPVLEDERLIGMISLKDLAQAIISEQRTMIEQLETYIIG